MNGFVERYGRIAGEFTRRVEAVPADAWENPAPCDGWVARDVVRHLVEWVPAFFFPRWGIDPGPIPSVDGDPAGAWRVVDAAIRAALADPAVAAVEHDLPMGRLALAPALDMIGTTDVLLHTWDLARATGGDERLDPAEVHTLLVGMEPYDEMLRTSGHYGPRVDVPADADEQTRLLAFIGRRP